MTAPSSRARDGALADDEPEIVSDPNLPPTSLTPEQDARDNRWTPTKIVIWIAIALLGAVAWAMLAIVRGETVNAIWFVFAAVATYFIGYRFYSKVIEKWIARPDDRRATPAEPVRQGGRVGQEGHGNSRIGRQRLLDIMISLGD